MSLGSIKKALSITPLLSGIVSSEASSMCAQQTVIHRCHLRQHEAQNVVIYNRQSHRTFITSSGVTSDTDHNNGDTQSLDSNHTHDDGSLIHNMTVDDGKSGSLSDGGGSDDRRGKRKVSLSLPTVFLPDKLQKALQSALAGYPSKALTSDGQVLAKFVLSRKVQTKLEAERRKNTSSHLHPWLDDKAVKKSKPFHLHFKYGKRETIAYAAGRLPAVYGTTLRVLTEVARRDPCFKPETLLDFGSGLGATVWAAHQLWAESVYEYQCVDVSSEMGDLARILREGGESPQREPRPPEISGVYFRQYLPLSNKVQYDVVVGAHTLGEIPSVKLRRMFLAALWRKTHKYLVLVEPGNWTGFSIITEARDMILQASKNWSKYEDESSEELEGHVFAPCPHDKLCPLANAMDMRFPCYFGQRVQLSLSERAGPLKHKGFHLENFSYVVLKKGHRERDDGVDARVLQPTRKRTRHVICKLCTKQGEVKEMVFTKSKHREMYKECRQSKWGDTLNHTSEHLTH